MARSWRSEPAEGGGPQIDLIGGDFEFGELGPTKLGDLVIDGPAPGGTLDLEVGDFVTTLLVKEQSTTPTTIVQLPEPGGPLVLAFGCALLAALHRFSGGRARRSPDPDRSSR